MECLKTYYPRVFVWNTAFQHNWKSGPILLLLKVCIVQPCSSPKIQASCSDLTAEWRSESFPSDSPFCKSEGKLNKSNKEHVMNDEVIRNHGRKILRKESNNTYFLTFLVLMYLKFVLLINIRVFYLHTRPCMFLSQQCNLLTTKKLHPKDLQNYISCSLWPRHGSSHSMAGGCTRLAIDEDKKLADIIWHVDIYIYIICMLCIDGIIYIYIQIWNGTTVGIL